MKANEFIKNHGIAEAKRVLHDARGCAGVKLWGRYEFSTDDPKRLVESHELVEEYGDLECVRRYVDSHDLYEAICDEDGNICDYVSNVYLTDAIADVESCQ